MVVLMMMVSGSLQHVSVSLLSPDMVAARTVFAVRGRRAGSGRASQSSDVSLSQSLGRH